MSILDGLTTTKCLRTQSRSVVQLGTRTQIGAGDVEQQGAECSAAL